MKIQMGGRADNKDQHLVTPLTIRRQVDFPFAVDYAGIGMLTFVVLLRTASAAVHLDHLVQVQALC